MLPVGIHDSLGALRRCQSSAKWIDPRIAALKEPRSGCLYVGRFPGLAAPNGPALPERGRAMGFPPETAAGAAGPAGGRRRPGGPPRAPPLPPPAPIKPATHNTEPHPLTSTPRALPLACPPPPRPPLPLPPSVLPLSLFPFFFVGAEPAAAV